MPKEPPIFGFNVIGHASAYCGLGNTLRQFVSCLETRSEKIRILDIHTGNGSSGADNSLEHLFASSAYDLPFAINLSIFGAFGLATLERFRPEGLSLVDRLNVGFVWWELTSLPQHLIDAAKTYDVIVAGSDFLYSVFKNNIPGIPVLLAPHPISIPRDIIPNRKRFKLPQQGFIVYMGFDPYSNIDRKNPFAAIEAFKQAFFDKTSCYLAIKLNYSGGGDQKIEESLAQLRSAAQLDPRILIIEKSLPYLDLLSLYASCDVFISLHRSEGLGLVPLEAMHLGKPVVATAWSGNMSYMNYSNACLVDFEFLPIDADVQTYGSHFLGIECQWAEPNISQAAAWLRKLADDPQFRFRIGQKAAVDAKRYEELAANVNFVDELKVIYENRALLPRRNRDDLTIKAKESKRKFEFENYLRKLSKTDRLIHLLKIQIDRHLTWRFKKN